MKKRNIMILTIALSLILLIGSSYAYLKISKESTNPYVMNVGTLQVTFEDNKTQQLQVQAKYPMIDAEGMTQNDELSFTIKNTGSVNVTYKVYIEETSTNPAFKSVMHYSDNKNNKGYSEVKVLETNKYIDEEGSLSVGQSATYKVKLWLGIDADNRYMDKTFKGKIIVELTQKEAGSLIEILKAKAYTEDSELIAIDVSDKNDIKKCESVIACAGKQIEYRFSGPTANNYIKLTDNEDHEEDWRIIGIFSDENGEEYLRVVRDSVLPADYLPDTYTINDATINGEKKKVVYTIKYPSEPWEAYFNKNDSGSELIRWEEAGLQYYLNTESDDASQKGYLSYLSNDVKELLQEKKLYLGTVTRDSGNSTLIDTPKQAYKYERATECEGGKGTISNNDEFTDSEKCRVWQGNMATYDNSKVSLMYPSDYGLSAIEANWTTKFGISSDEETGFYAASVFTTTWMYNTMADSKSNVGWFISSSTADPRFIPGWAITGVYIYYSTFYLGVRPVLNLSLNTNYVSGDGTSSASAYRIFE